MLGNGGPGSAVFEKGDELFGIAGWRQTGLAGADHGEWFVRREMGESFFEGASEIGEQGAGSESLAAVLGKSEDGFAEAEDAMGGGFEGLRGGFVRGTGDDDLYRMMREERGG